jgi:hypothetical protein
MALDVVIEEIGLVKCFTNNDKNNSIARLKTSSNNLKPLKSKKQLLKTNKSTIETKFDLISKQAII